MEVSGQRGSDKACDICVRSRSISRAVFGYCVDCRDYLCKDCYFVHIGHKSSVNHKLLEGNQVPKVRSCPVDMCQTHTDEKILYFCKEHSALACQKCAFLQHRMCAEVNDIVTLSRDPDNVKRCDEMKKEIAQLEAFIETHRQTRKECLLKIDEKKKRVKSEIKNFCNMLHDRLHRMEQKMIEEVQEIGDEDAINVATILQECDTVSADLDIVVNDLKTNQDPGRKDQLFIAVQKAAAAIAILESRVTKLTDNNIVREYSFNPIECLTRIIDDVKGLGDLSVCDEGNKLGNLQCHSVSPKPLSQLLSKVGLSPRWNYDNVTAKTDGNIGIKTEEDKNTCSITGCTMLEGDTTLAVVDMKNVCVKLVDIRQRKVVSRISLSVCPLDITYIKPDQLVVTLILGNKLQFVSVNGTILSLGREIKVSDWCRGINFHNGRLLISFTGYPARVQILTVFGSVLNTISPQTDGQFLFSWPRYLACSSSLFVTDSENNSLHCLDMDGNVKATFTDHSLDQPFGLTMTEKDAMIVCGHDSNNLFVVSSDCRRGKVLVDVSRGIQRPLSVTYSSTLSTVFVGQEGYDTLKVFKLTLTED